ncbi:MAG TPA: nucleotidyltransferase domain-containing protein [Solirubrobacteraceae bacterium]|nr:nucleotidyltransferase domain-containing protein [Solirubrobacteraceae bacterium]
MDFRKPLSVVTPSLDGDVLAALARADVELTSGEIQRLTGVGSLQGIRNAAERLTREGVVSRRVAGSAHLFSLNRQHVAAESIEALSRLPENIVGRLRETIAAWSRPPTFALLFGSVATGSATSESDVDLLIVRPSNIDPDSQPWARQLTSLQAETSAWTGNDARILEYGDEDLPTDDPVLVVALREGIELFGSARALRAVRREMKRG